MSRCSQCHDFRQELARKDHKIAELERHVQEARVANSKAAGARETNNLTLTKTYPTFTDPGLYEKDRRPCLEASWAGAKKRLNSNVRG